jgi:hypothetical protein
MSPLTHLLGSWLLAAKGTRNAQDCRLVTLAGVVPDLDGAGLLLDIADSLSGRPVHFHYLAWHHFVLHGLPAAIVLALLAGALARDKARVVFLCLLVFHLHLLCDLVGSRGPDPADIWTIAYLGPFSHDWTFGWSGQWPLHAWPNRVTTLFLLGLALWLPLRLGYSVVGVFSSRADRAVVAVLQRWHRRLTTALRR